MQALTSPISSPLGGSRVDVNHYKCVVVGDGGVGKTSMLLRFVQGDFLNEYTPTDYDSFTISMALGNEWMPCTMTLVDTAGQETYDRLRTLTYYDTDVFIVCFSVACPDSFINVKSRWIPELKEFKPKTPIILVGTQADLRDKHEKRLQFSSSQNISSSKHGSKSPNGVSKTDSHLNLSSTHFELSKNNNSSKDSSFSSQGSSSYSSYSKSTTKGDYNDDFTIRRHSHGEAPPFISHKEGKKTGTQTERPDVLRMFRADRRRARPDFLPSSHDGRVAEKEAPVLAAV